MNCQLSVCQTDTRSPFPSIDSVFPSVCQLPLQLLLRPDILLCVFSTALLPRSIPCHLLCVDRVFNFANSPPTPNLFVVPANPSFFTFCVSIARFQLPLRIRFRYQKGHRHLGEVPRSYTFIRLSAFLRCQRRYLCCSDTSFVQAKQKVTVALSLVTIL